MIIYLLLCFGSIRPNRDILTGRTFAHLQVYEHSEFPMQYLNIAICFIFHCSMGKYLDTFENWNGIERNIQMFHGIPRITMRKFRRISLNARSIWIFYLNKLMNMHKIARNYYQNMQYGQVLLFIIIIHPIK